MTILTENRHTAEFIVSEANNMRSRKEVTIGTALDLKAGHVLGEITATGKFIEMDPVAVDGSQVVAAILYADAKAALADVQATVVFGDAEVVDALLVYITGITGPQKLAAEAEIDTLGIVRR